MDSVSQFVLGASVAVVALGDRTRPWRAVLTGGIVATLPDLDVLIDHGDAVRNMTCHRADSHALLWLSLLAPLLGWLAAVVHRQRPVWRRWTLAVWLALVTHPLLDAMTIYGTQLGRPFTDHPFAVGSLFVIDPLYTLPLLVGLVVLLWRGDRRGRRWNGLGLVLSIAYAAWSLVAQQWATEAARAALAAQGLSYTRLVVTPAPLQTVLWRVLAVGEREAYEGFWSLCDGQLPIVFTRIDRGADSLATLRGIWAVDRLQWFSGGCTKVERQGRALRLTDLRMGQEPFYIFSFVVAELGADGLPVPVVAPERSGARIEVGRALGWLWPRMWGGDVPTPR